ncbi:MAG TPA: peptidoglycan DD-metalloendopeptidase family protein [Candidatus Limnocylindrales bacterium]|nr:peptidoglycan DD-metalloendopeptidase family protein [Candidatus Limnocylindrales bacterium]
MTKGFRARQKTSKVVLAIGALFLLSVLGAASLNTPLVEANSSLQLQQLQKEINQVQNDSNHKHEAQGVLDIEASSLADAIAKLQTQIDASQARINQLQGDADSLNRQITEIEAELNKQKEILGEIIKIMYIEGDISTVEMLATSKSFSDFVDREQYRMSVQERVKAALIKITQLKHELDTKRKTVQATLGEQQGLQNQLASQRTEKDRILALNQDQRNQLEGQIRANSGKIAELKKKQAEMEAALGRSLNSGSYRVAPVGYVSAGDAVGAIGNSGFSSGPHLHLEVRRGGIINPGPYIKAAPVNMPPAWISQAYGAANSWYASGYHSGIDYAASTGSPIFAIDGGQMYRGCSNQLLGTRTNGYGYIAIVEHSNGTRSIYAHMSGGPAACSYNTF